MRTEKNGHGHSVLELASEVVMALMRTTSQPKELPNPCRSIEQLFDAEPTVVLASNGHALWLTGPNHRERRRFLNSTDLPDGELLRNSSVLAIGRKDSRDQFQPRVLLGAHLGEPGLPEAPAGYRWADSLLATSDWMELIGPARQLLGYNQHHPPRGSTPVLYLVPDDST